ncbi:MAG: phosphoribosylpyrophosphate synthetase [Weeksellaceae bacterium]|nr:phosphoribosylpyrophosphate synthetase [Weeksellaceae bacterium]
MQHNYNTLSEAIEGMKKEGYTEDFNLTENEIKCMGTELCYNPESFEIHNALRFEGMSNPDDNSVLYAIEANDGTKGLLVDAYGAYAEAISPKMARKLRVDYTKD